MIATIIFYFINKKSTHVPVELHAPGAEKSIEELYL